MYETINVEKAQAHLAELITGLTDVDLKILPNTCHENTPGHTFLRLVLQAPHRQRMRTADIFGGIAIYCEIENAAAEDK